MRIAIASGKGGTGKTTVAVNLALTLAKRMEVSLLDCDVEEPNCDLFLDIPLDTKTEVIVQVPWVDAKRCTACGVCATVCQYNAIAAVKPTAMVFSELCHGCGGCALYCPAGAITEMPIVVGYVLEGTKGNLRVVKGLLNVGQVMATPVIRDVRKKAARREELTLLDSPPGTSCPMIAAARDADFSLLVTEPTPFGLNDLILAVETVRAMKIPFGVVVNRAGSGDDRVQKYCEAESIPLLLEIPDDRRVAEAYSRGVAAVDAVPELRAAFDSLYMSILKRKYA